MQPLSSLIVIDKALRLPVYLQITGQLQQLIQTGLLPAGTRLPSTRNMAALLQVHRKTVIKAYDELLAQGWLQSRLGSGTYVARHMPQITLQKTADQNAESVAKTAGFAFNSAPHLNRKVIKVNTTYHLDDGFPDIRLAPLHDLSRAYRTQLLMGNPYVRLGYSDTKGSEWLRQELSLYLNETRGLQTTPENILIVRGTVMGLYLVSTGLIQPGDNVVVGSLSWAGADTNFIQAGANLIRVTVDEHGLRVDELEQICRQKPVRLVYLTSHHHYPTTVALRADRRIELLRLAEKYGFIIFEDDYDYDFHYLNKPLLPLAGADRAGMVLYCGSFTKTISPAFRVGYLVGPQDVINHLAQLRRIIDRQGDTMLENAMAELLQNGIIQRHMRKALRAYRQRRDIFCNLLSSQLGNYTSFNIPDGGMAVWTEFDPQININQLAQKALKKDLFLADGSAPGAANAIRLGFTSSTETELERSVEILVDLLK